LHHRHQLKYHNFYSLRHDLYMLHVTEFLLASQQESSRFQPFPFFEEGSNPNRLPLSIVILGIGENCVNSWQKLGIILWVCRGQPLCCPMRNAYNPGRTATGGCPYNRRSTPENLKSAISDRARYKSSFKKHSIRTYKKPKFQRSIATVETWVKKHGS
jgi:hypothetical protein